MGDTWEQRMSLRAKLRAKATREAEQRDQTIEDRRRAILEKRWRRTPEPEWLHGWPRTTLNSVDMGNANLCVGCGRVLGTWSVWIPDGWDPNPETRPDPLWPFPIGGCPVCQEEDGGEPLTVRLT